MTNDIMKNNIMANNINSYKHILDNGSNSKISSIKNINNNNIHIQGSNHNINNNHSNKHIRN